jgi:hypothetical protein
LTKQQRGFRNERFWKPAVTRIYLSHIAALRGGSHPGLFGPRRDSPLPKPRALCAADHRAWAIGFREASAGLKAKLCIAQGEPADILENFESRGFPQGFLNHLETPAP